MNIAIKSRACLDGSGSALRNEVFNEREGIDPCDYPISADSKVAIDIIIAYRS